MTRRPFLSVCAFALAMATPAPAQLVFSDFNAVIGGNLTSPTEIEGRTIVRGNLTGQNSSNYATKLFGSGAGTDTLIVGGSILGGNPIQVESGNVSVGGDIVDRQVNMNGGGTITTGDATATSRANDVVGQLAGASAFYRGLASDSTVTTGFNGPNQPSAVRFNATPGADNIAVFNFNGSIFSNNLSQQYELNLGAGVNDTTSFIFNVSGTNINFNQGNFVGAFDTLLRQSRILFNFFEATNIALQNRFTGSILAANANLSNQTNIDGSVFIGGNFNQNGEVHLPNFIPPPQPAPVPEPATYLLLSMGLAAGYYCRRNRRATDSDEQPPLASA